MPLNTKEQNKSKEKFKTMVFLAVWKLTFSTKIAFKNNVVLVLALQEGFNGVNRQSRKSGFFWPLSNHDVLLVVAQLLLFF